MILDPLCPEAFFQLSQFEDRRLFQDCAFVWNALERLPDYIKETIQPNAALLERIGEPLPRTVVLWRGQRWEEGEFEILGGSVDKKTFQVRVGGETVNRAVVVRAGAVIMDPEVELRPGALVEAGALIKGPTIIGEHTEVRQGAYIRGKCLTGSCCVVGHTTEMKSSIMLDGAKAGHFAYIGDSILGNRVNLGAGTKMANLRLRGAEVRFRMGDETIRTGMRKLGAILGDDVETGCNSVTNPGALLAPGCLVFPTVSVAPGYYEPERAITGKGR